MDDRDLSRLRDELTGRARALDAEPSRLALAVKRAIDLFGAVLGLLLLWPLLLILAIAVRLDSHGPAMFTQRRLGRWGRPFTLYKLRTMVKDAEEKGPGLAIEKNDARITRVGAVLRKTSLDEVPQLINVLRGDMSFVGPRPLPVAYLERWDERQRLRLVMPQGITGWSQVTMRNDGPWPERLEKDVEYLENWSLVFDTRIFLTTLLKTVRRSGIETEEGGVREFTGEAPTSTSTTETTER
ncbi:MAG: sugar transferase [Armatimonadota bacterium]|jgi:lipopolysaccharide/colanic/teichoic acid biosynthesis glycosyltransferase